MLTLRIQGSGSGHWIGWSLLRDSIGCSTGLNYTVTSIPWGAAAVPAAVPVTSAFGGNTSLSSRSPSSHSSHRTLIQFDNLG
jgi:hypothetical protein